MNNLIVYFQQQFSFLSFLPLFGLLILSGFFSASEIAIFRVQDYQLKEEDNSLKKAKKYTLLYKLINNKEKTLSTILIGNNIANVFTSIYGSYLISTILIHFGVSQEIALSIAGATLVVLLLLLGEILPKTIAIYNSLRWALIFAPVIYLLSIFFYPVTFFTGLFSSLINKFFKKADEIITNNQVLAIVKQGGKSGVFEKNEQDVIKNILNFNETSVMTIMTPRNNVFTLSEEEKVSQVKNIIAKQEYTRIPIYKGNDVNNITGIIHQNELFKQLVKNGRKVVKLGNLAQAPTYLYQKTTIQKAFELLQKEHKHMAIIVDDFGSFEGIVTMEDILEEIVGEIRDETDSLKKDSSITPLGKNNWIAQNVVDLNTFYRVTGANSLEHDDLPYETLQGLIMFQLQRLPKKGDKVVSGKFWFEVKEMKEDQIRTIQIKKIVKRSKS